MRLSDYQRFAQETDRASGTDERAMLVPLLGLAGEVGSLLTEYKKLLRDRHAHRRFREQVAEDLGDLLWYAANAASKFGLDLEEVAEANLEKVRDRWPKPSLQPELFPERPDLFDAHYPPGEQLPRRFEVTLREQTGPDGGDMRVAVRIDGRQVGDLLTDNAHGDDGYRYHDVFHYAYVAILGWSPVARKLLGRKRKSDARVDEIEDGARAQIVEELISHLVYTYAREHDYLEGVGEIDYHLLKTIRTVAAGYEVEARSLAEWEDAILQGYSAWRRIRDAGGGRLAVDVLGRRLRVIE